MSYRPIYSTKNLYPVWQVVLLCITVVVCAIIVAVKFAGLSVLLVAAGCFLAIPLIKTIGLRKSHVVVYDDMIAGITLPRKIVGGLNEMHSFELSYSEITGLSYKKNVVIISCNGGTYEVQAYKCEDYVVRLIKKQKALLEQTT